VQGVAEHQPVEQRRTADDERVEHHGDRLAAVLAHQVRRERDQHDQREVREVDHQQPPVEVVQRTERLVVRDPETPDHREAQEVREQLRPGVDEDAVQVAIRQLLGHVDAQHEHGDRDREHAVGERDDAGELDRLPHRRAGLLHQPVVLAR
jgi:hypothetical protein